MELNARVLTRLAAAGLIVAALPLWLAARGSDGGQPTASAEPEPVAVRVAPVERRSVSHPIVAPGTFGYRDEARLSFKIGGVIDRVAVEQGASVRAGDVLAALDLREIDAVLRKAESAAAKAERDLERAGRLYADSVVTLAQLQDAETGAEVARADLETARFNRRYAVIVAATDGVVLRRSAEAGETVAPGAPVLVLGSRARGAVMRVGLTDRDVVRVRVGDPALARFDAAGDHAFPGVVTEIGADATAGTGTYAVEIRLEDPGALAAGMVGRVEIVPNASGAATVVPVEAVLEADGGRATVFTLGAGRTRVERRQVTIGFIDGDAVAVTSGLDGADAVVTEGAAWLDDGDAVRVVP